MVEKPECTTMAWQAFKESYGDFFQDDAALRDHMDAQQLCVYTLTLRDVGAPDGLHRAAYAGVRFLVVRGDAVLAADVADTSQYETPQMTGVSRDPKLVRTIKLMKEIDEYPEVKGSDVYELRLLRIPSILVEAFWLWHKGGGEDFIAPFTSADESLQLHRMYRWPEFSAAAKKLADKYAEFDNMTEEG